MMSKILQLKVPVNPEYDFEQDPHDQAEYVNPVTLAHKQAYVMNYAVEVTAALTRINLRLADLKVQLRAAERAQEDFEAALLARFPAPAAERKSNKLLEAYITRLAFESGGQEIYGKLIAERRAREDELELATADLENARYVHQTLKLLSELGQTYLSFYKHEVRMSGTG